MAQIVVTLKIMPESPDVEFSAIEKQAREKITEFGVAVARVEHEPIAFGLKALKMMFTMDENIGSTEDMENDIATVAGVNSVQVTDVRRTVG